MKNYILFSYEALSMIYKDGAYSSIALSNVLHYLNEKDKAMVSKSVSGVLEHHQEFSYAIKKLCKKSPRPSVRICLRLGMYYLKYMDSIPDYAVVNEIVELTKTQKKEQAGFVNATLKQYINIKNDLPDGAEGLSVKYNIPLWLLNEYTREYGEEQTAKIFAERSRLTHVRINKSKTTCEKFISFCNERNISYVPTEYGFLISSTSPFSEWFSKGLLTVMALDSIIVCNTLSDGKPTSDALDLCSAPGGKSVYLAESNSDITVYSADIHAHRIELVKSYAERMGVKNIVTKVADSRVFVPEWANRFNYVLLDAPCSGVGVLNDNPDIILHRTLDDIYQLSEIQTELLLTASKYVKVGGKLVYSTCSNLKIENEEIVNNFLSTVDDFILEPSDVLPERSAYYTFIPNDRGHSGFFVANLRRVK